MAEGSTRLYLGNTPIDFSYLGGNGILYNPATIPVFPNIYQTGLLRWYDAEYDSNSSTWGDLTNTQDATVVNASYQDTTSPFYYDFGGTNEYAGHSATSDLSLTSMTISAWIQMKSNADTQFCWVSQRSGLGSGTRYSLHINAGGNLLGIYNGSAFNTISVTIDPDIWYFITAEITTTATQYYVNTTAQTSIPSGLNTGAGNQPFGIATPNYGLTDFSGEFLVGYVGMVLVYDGNIGSTEITNNFNATKARFGL
jgi:hypothetical protein